MGSKNYLNHILINAIQHLPIGIFWKDIHGQYLGCNKHCLSLFDLPSEQFIIGKTDAQLKPAFKEKQLPTEELYQTDQEALIHGRSVIAKAMTLETIHGHQQFEITKIPLKNRAGKTIGLLGIAIDVSSKFRSEQKLQEKTALLNSIFDALPDSVIYKDMEGRIVECNRAALKLAKKKKTDIIGKTIEQILPAATAQVSIDYDTQLKSNYKSVNYKIEFELAGRQIYVDVHKHPVIQNNTLVGTVSISRDIKERRNTLEKIATLTKHDQLTKLLNRPTFLQSLEDIDQDSHWGILLIDIKKLGQLNSNYGTEIGDQVLIYVGEQIKKIVPEDAFLARIQGDRFAILTNQASSPDQLNYLCDKLIDKLNMQIAIQGHVIDLAICIGAANYPNTVQETNQLLTCSELALSRSRKHTEQYYTLFDPVLEAHAEAEKRLIHDLKHAINNKAIDLYYQPIVDANSKAVLGVEALARWHHPEQGLIMPIKFIELAEKNNLIGQLGEVVLEKACQQLSRWRAQGIDIFMAVNLSPIQFNDPQLISKIKYYIDYYDIPAHRLEIEVTESALMESNHTTGHMLEELINLGVRLSIDDFGTGYCSLSYLKNMPAHKLKIDKSFVDELELDKTTTAITRSVISLARELNITVTAEGVEKESQMKWLQAQQCDQFQGYLFSRPLPSDQFCVWYEQHHVTHNNITYLQPAEKNMSLPTL
ncbi:EAL domain-containing protein [Moritella sp.]|uniref:sensor domain-containing protein n=1 Tax=Moritella sp. TaxID=78556 RepID=UPI001DDC4D56|nr:EAL domain-containing protein [Moritella sp.]MCJ8350859.1 EAL domain-containing protein [Moritella sp.]NQZ40453.1 EAL domain-containing protein [Moritella sp.]